MSMSECVHLYTLTPLSAMLSRLSMDLIIDRNGACPRELFLFCGRGNEFKTDVPTANTT